MWSPGAARPGATRLASAPSSRSRAPGEWGVVVGAGGLVANEVQQFGLVLRAWLHFIFAGVRSSLLRSGRVLRFFLSDLGVVDAWAGRPRTSRSLGVAHSSLAPRVQASVWPLAGSQMHLSAGARICCSAWTLPSCLPSGLSASPGGDAVQVPPVLQGLQIMCVLGRISFLRPEGGFPGGGQEPAKLS